MPCTVVLMARTLGHEINRVRKLQGLSLTAVAKPAGVSATYLQKLERDEVESPSPHRLSHLAEVLGVAYADLFRLAGYPLPELAPAEASNSGSNADDAPVPSAVRRIFLSEDAVSDPEIEELLNYLRFMPRAAQE